VHIREQDRPRSRRIDPDHLRRGSGPHLAQDQGPFVSHVSPQRGGFLPVTIDEFGGRNEIVLRLHQSGMRTQVDPAVVAWQRRNVVFPRRSD